jgi:hypothetical protein
VLEQQPDDAHRDRARDQQPAQARVDVIGADLAHAQRAPQTLDDPHPVLEEDAQQHDRRGEVGCDQKRQEELVVLMDVPARHAGQDDAVTEARDRERLGDALREAEDHGLKVGDGVHRDDSL